MDQKIFLKYLEQYTQDALKHSGDDLSQAADYVEKIPRPGMFAKNKVEKRAALDRVKKVFASSRGRSWYVVLKSLGFDDLAKEKL